MARRVRTLALPLLAGALLMVTGCPSTAGSPAPTTDGGADVHVATGGRDGAADSTPDHRHAPLPDASDSSTEPPDASPPTDAGPVRTLTTRALLPTPVNSLLMDPFVTADESWGHFRAVVPSIDPADTGGDCPYIARELMSASPVGISAPTLLVSPTVLPPSYGCTAILAPCVGSSETVSAQLWVSVLDATGAPVGSTDGGAAGVDAYLSVALLPNSLPSGPTQPSYPLTLSSTAPVAIGGKVWVVLELASPVAMPDGGWFSITIVKTDAQLYFAGPEVVPTAAGQIAHRPSSITTGRSMTDRERGAIAQYGRLRDTRPPRRRPRRPRLVRPLIAN